MLAREERRMKRKPDDVAEELDNAEKESRQRRRSLSGKSCKVSDFKEA
jgi:hypothetical protein